MRASQSLHKRLLLLETQRKQPDFKDIALDSLTDAELDACQEYLELEGCGHEPEEIRGMMSKESWDKYHDGLQRYNLEYERLVKEEDRGKIEDYGQSATSGTMAE
jgi:hypothetical protein